MQKEYNVIEKILDKVKIGNTFLALGFIVTIVSIFLKSDLYLKLGLLHLFFGGVFRFLNILVGNIQIKYGLLTIKNISAIVLKFLIWLASFAIYGFFLNNLVRIF